MGKVGEEDFQGVVPISRRIKVVVYQLVHWENSKRGFMQFASPDKTYPLNKIGKGAITVK